MSQVDLDWCIAGCSKRSQQGSLYCSTTCYSSSISVDFNVSPALSYTSSVNPPSPLFLATTLQSDAPLFMLSPFKNKPNSHHSSHKKLF
ncbi:hypothetical protein BC833DRAFT_581712 [Globomyces pollinis-pini]|nr:hypothetical protein BC833DRAFT_581712 [Globomyces pollinis-pini]KAJ2993230.1 hypothetical protein HDV02_002573 [Globomyces sp. JEL0801]